MLRRALSFSACSPISLIPLGNIHLIRFTGCHVASFQISFVSKQQVELTNTKPAICRDWREIDKRLWLIENHSAVNVWLLITWWVIGPRWSAHIRSWWGNPSGKIFITQSSRYLSCRDSSTGLKGVEHLDAIEKQTIMISISWKL